MLDAHKYIDIIDAEHPFGPAVSDVLLQHPDVFTEFFETGYLFAAATQRASLVIQLNTSTCLMDISRILATDENNRHRIAVDFVRRMWDLAIWCAIISRLGPSEILDEDNPDQDIVDQFRTGLLRTGPNSDPTDAFSRFCTTIVGHASQTPLANVAISRIAYRRIRISEAIDAAKRLMKAANISALILLDSVDDEEKWLQGSPDCVAGLLSLQGDAFRAKSPYVIRMALPSELWSLVGDCSTNVSKDFEGLLRINWSARDLIRVAAHRFSIYVRLYHYDRLQEAGLAELDIATPTGAKELLRRVLPEWIINSLGTRENGLAYVLRHTQLLPRHLILILNKIWTARESRANPLEIKASVVREAIASCEQDLANEICTAYKPTYPMASDVCGALFPELTMSFSESDFDKKYQKFAKGAAWGMSSSEARQMLIDMGALGQELSRSDLYIEADFRYRRENLAVSTSGRMCMHPLFIGRFGCAEMQAAYSGSRLPIYPRGWDPEASEED